MSEPKTDRIWHPYTRLSAEAEGFPTIVRGEGLYLYDAQGRRYLDAISSWWACALGHGHPRLVAAIRRQAGLLDHSILGNLAHPPALELAARLADLMPDPDRRVLFASDGACAVEAALRIAWQQAHALGEPDRRLIAGLEGAYHGDTLGAVAAGYLEAFHAPLRPVLAPSIRLPLPTAPGGEAAALDEARRRLAAHAGRVAALVVEPLCLGASGMRMYGPGYLRGLHALAREAGALFIADEIAMGFGRTGRRFAFEHAGIDPDIVCVGKALSAGTLPISAAIVRGAIHRRFSDAGPVDRTLYHGHTFAGNPIAAAAALAALDVYAAEDLPARAARLGRRLAVRLAPLRECTGVRDVRVLGLIGAVELDDAGGTGAVRARAVQRRLLEAGILLRPLGPVVYVMPPLVIDAAALDALADALVGAVRALAVGHPP